MKSGRNSRGKPTVRQSVSCLFPHCFWVLCSLTSFGIGCAIWFRWLAASLFFTILAVLFAVVYIVLVIGRLEQMGRDATVKESSNLRNPLSGKLSAIGQWYETAIIRLGGNCGMRVRDLFRLAVEMAAGLTIVMLLMSIGVRLAISPLYGAF